MKLKTSCHLPHLVNVKYLYLRTYHLDTGNCAYSFRQVKRARDPISVLWTVYEQVFFRIEIAILTKDPIRLHGPIPFEANDPLLAKFR